MIQFLLLSMNQHPFGFKETEDKEIYIKRFANPSWEFTENMNEKARDFFKRACAIKFVDRFSAQQALQHTWITGEGKISDPITLNDMFKLYEQKENFIKIVRGLVVLQAMKR